MRLKITGRNIELTEGLKAAVEERLSRLDKYFNDDTIANVTMSVEKERQKIEVTIPINGGVIRSEQVSSDMYVSIDLVEETIERQLKKHRQKLITKQQAADSDFKQAFLDAEDEEDVEQIKIVRSKKFDMKPMYAEDACIQMDLLGHDFFVFRNAETDEINVVYKRRGNTYGLIEPDF
ncbi:MAG: ribosome-associated translation inhibitor RaiA [Lachnospiraceae bacterium]|jgi:putative sigma-54 modulation protein|nr:ribosome-associated translation inhibitor RaiA [Lachnospiraceae bacterium]MCI7328296.1 ribosome-associated translation inhibitor RaiA [Lachnospiraceae bacterium]MDD7702547.1 ribosome-associated translation inhibitor RaiA [Lachnospiraceae bacterium]MDY3302010.1 ribosome-associated translation inhibitor RaiA [Lachnospiraceae bacterium]MEE3379750.1 ribosome-associated translation inhibitor RaiA [Lachnospiraceae bacterium]